MHTDRHTSTHTHTHTQTHTRTHTHTHTHTQTHKHTNTHTCACTHTHVHTQYMCSYIAHTWNRCIEYTMITSGVHCATHIGAYMATLSNMYGVTLECTGSRWSTQGHIGVHRVTLEHTGSHGSYIAEGNIRVHRVTLECTIHRGYRVHRPTSSFRHHCVRGTISRDTKPVERGGKYCGVWEDSGCYPCS